MMIGLQKHKTTKQDLDFETVSRIWILKLSVCQIWIGFWNGIVGLDLDLKTWIFFIFTYNLLV